jgi:hypothetical protein
MFIINLIGIINIMYIYQLYLNICKYIINFYQWIIRLLKYNKVNKIEFVYDSSKNKEKFNKFTSIILNSNSINLDNINKSSISSKFGYLKIDYYLNDKNNTMIVPWNNDIDQSNGDIQIINTDKKISNYNIQLFNPVNIIYASDSDGNDYTDIIKKYSGHLSEDTYCVTKAIDEFGKECIIYKNLSMNIIRPYITKKELEIMTADGDILNI